MNKRNENRNRMIIASMSVLNKYNNLWENIPVFKAVTKEITEKQKQISELRSVAEADITGKTDDKNKHEELLLQSVYTISSNLYVMARRANNQEIMKKVDYSITELSRTREAELVSECHRVVSLARENLTILEGSGTEETQIDELEALANTMGSMIGEPRVSQAERKAANESLSAAINQVVTLLSEQLDRLMVRFKLSNTDFFAEYMNARHIVAYGIRHESEESNAAA